MMCTAPKYVSFKTLLIDNDRVIVVCGARHIADPSVGWLSESQPKARRSVLT